MSLRSQPHRRLVSGAAPARILRPRTIKVLIHSPNPTAARSTDGAPPLFPIAIACVSPLSGGSYIIVLTWLIRVIRGGTPLRIDRTRIVHQAGKNGTGCADYRLPRAKT